MSSTPIYKIIKYQIVTREVIEPPSNAFNSVSWQIILNKLRKGNIMKNLIKLIRSYLTEREIIIEAKDLRRTRTISSEVPQGSVLGPT